MMHMNSVYHLCYLMFQFMMGYLMPQLLSLAVIVFYVVVILWSIACYQNEK